MADSARVGEDLVVIATRVSLVTEEMNILVFDSTLLGIFLEVAKAVGLVPAGRENVERDLTADREALRELEMQTKLRKE